MTHVDVTISLDTYNTANSREHWGTRARNARRQRAAVGKVLWAKPMPRGPWVVTLTRIADRLLDTDGLTSSLKAVRDAVADRLGCDDGPRAPVTWCYAQARGPRSVRIEIASRDHAGNLRGNEGAPDAGDAALVGQGAPDVGEGETGRTKLSSPGDGRLLVGDGHERLPVVGQGPAVGDAAHALPALALDPEGALGPRSNQRALVRPERIENRAHEGALWTVRRARTVRRHDARPEAPGEALGRCRYHDVTGEPVALGHGEEAGPELLYIGESRHEPGPRVDRGRAAHPMVDVPRHDPHALPSRPSLDLGPLRIEPKRLVRGADARVTDRHLHVPRPRRSLRHACLTDVGPFEF